MTSDTDSPLTDQIIASLPPPPKGNRIRWDGHLSGFGCRVTSAGARSFVFRYRNASGRDSLITIGGVGVWNVKRARKQAEILRLEVDTGGDPLAARRTRLNAPTMNELCDRFDAEHVVRRRPATQADYRSIVRLHIRPTLGQRKVEDIRPADVERLHASIAAGSPRQAPAPYRANRTVAVLSKMFSLAIKWDLREDNPARSVEREPELRRERFLTPVEVARLSEVLENHPERTSANAIRLLLLTGARRGETLSATWSAFDLDAGVWTKPAHSTKQAREHRVPLSAPARELLAAMKSDADRENERRRRDGLAELTHVFPGREGRPLTEIKRFWASVCRKAGLSAVRVHDLRHTYASILASHGQSLPIIGALLGHSQAATTNRYAHLLDDPLRAATERVGQVVTGSVRSSA